MEIITPELELHLNMLQHVIWEGGDDGDMDVPLGIDDTATPEEVAEYHRWREEERIKEEAFEKARKALEAGDPDWERFLPEGWDLDK